MNFRFQNLLLASLLVLTAASCESDKTKKTAAQPHPKAMAPTVTASNAAAPVARQDPAPQQQAQEAKSASKPDAADELITEVEKKYQAGQSDYAAGHLDAAREDFNGAFNTLLGSELSVRKDERLQQEFDKLTESVHNLELAALQQGDGFTERTAEPAPIDEVNNLTFPVDPNVKAKAETEIKEIHSDLPIVLNDRVASYLSYFASGGHGYVEKAMIRAGRYQEMIRQIFKEEGVPQDLIFLAEAESGFKPLALNKSGARGMWQFMWSRAVDYGLKRSWWLDERQDPEKSTRAAARHLRDLYKQFGDWYLAMAAYDSGPGTVQQAVQRTGYADFWELYRRNVLPAETKNYVPIILAFTIMAKNPEQYGLDQITPDPPFHADRVKVDYPVDLRLVAECVDSSVTTIQDLNPALLRMTTPKEGSYELKVPAGTGDKYQKAIASIPRDMRVAWRYHRVAPGESLTEIARQYHTTVRAIQQVNSMDGDTDLRRDAKLIIPVTPRRGGDSEGFSYARKPTIYKVRKGDTALSIADDFGVPVEKVRRWNHLRGNELHAGHVLRIYKPMNVGESEATVKRVAVSRNESSRTASKHSSSKQIQASAKQRRTLHKVRKGETLNSIAENYHTTVAALRRDNARLSSNIHPGDVLVVNAGR